MRFFNYLFKQLLIVNCFALSCFALSEPWIDTSDIYLKAHIQLLADTGFITVPVTTYPLIWSDIIRDLHNINQSELTTNQQNAYHYIKHQSKLARKNQTRIKVHIGIDDKRFVSFGEMVGDKNSISVHSSMMVGNFAAKIAPSYTSNPIDSDKNRLDESYLAAFLGNWVVAYGRQNRWYGPTWDTSLSLSNNARPITALSLSRKSAEAFIVPFTEFDIPWTMTTFMGQMDDERTIEDTLLWGFRLNVKPFKNLELGITRLAQWGGNGQKQGFSSFWNILIGRTNCGVDGVVCEGKNDTPNQQAGYDFRYSFSLFNVPMSLYGQNFAEDGNADSGSYLTKIQPQIGLDINVSPFNKASTFFIEFADTYAECGKYISAGNGNCFYEHQRYRTGMRYNRRTIGSAYDNDSKTYVLGAISQLSSHTRLTTKLRYLDLNYDNSDKAADNPIIGNPITSIAEQVWMMSASAQHDYQNWRFTLAAQISHSNFPGTNNMNSSNDINASIAVEYNL